MAVKFSGEQPMREQILKLLKAVPFTPFVVDVAEDVQYSIGTNDHATGLACLRNGLQRIWVFQRREIAQIRLAQVARANQPTQHLSVARLGQLPHK